MMFQNHRHVRWVTVMTRAIFFVWLIVPRGRPLNQARVETLRENGIRWMLERTIPVLCWCNLGDTNKHVGWLVGAGCTDEPVSLSVRYKYARQTRSGFISCNTVRPSMHKPNEFPSGVWS